MAFSRNPGSKKGPGPSRSGPMDATDALNEIKAGLFGIGERLDALFGAATSQGAGEGSGTASSHQTFETTIGDKLAKGVFGVSVKMGLDGAEARSTGTLKPEQARADTAQAREPMIDLYQEAEEIVITAELPGVEPEDINVLFDQGSLRITTRGRRRYDATVPIEDQVDPSSLHHHYTNGILEVRLDRSAP